MYASRVSQELADQPSRQRRLLVVDDHPVLRQGVSAILEKAHDFTVCAEAGNAAEAIDAVRTHRPDAAVIDISLPGTDGIELIKIMKRMQPNLKILVLSMQEEWEYGVPALRAGANGYLAKDHTAEELVPAIRHVLDGSLHISDELKRRLLSFAPDSPPENPLEAPANSETVVPLK